MKIYQKEALKLQLEINDPDGEPTDLAGSTVKLRISARGFAVELEKTCTIIGPGLVEADLTSDDLNLECGLYIQEWRLFELGGAITTVLRADLVVSESLFGGN